MRSSETRRDLMKSCKELAQKYWPTEISIANQIDKIYYEILKKTPEVRPQTRVQQANYALAIRSYRALHRAFDDLEDGYYEISMTLLRSVYENYVQMDYFATHHEAARQWIEEDKTFKQDMMRKHLLLSSDFYKRLSNDYAHPLSVKSLNPMIFDIAEDGKLSLNHYPVFSPDRCYTCLFIWIWLADKVINQVQRVFKAEQIKDKSWMKRVVGVQALVQQYIKEEQYARQKAAHSHAKKAEQ